MKIKTSEITIDPAVAIREGTDEDTIQRYEEIFDELPPITVYKTDHTYLLADGFHRWAAATRIGRIEIEAEVKEGSQDEAMEYVISANLKHGRPLTREEYAGAVRRLKTLHSDWSSVKIGNKIGRDHVFVLRVFHADEVTNSSCTDVQIPNTVASEIHKAPKETWSKLAEAASEGEWTERKTIEVVRIVKNDYKDNPNIVEEITTPREEINTPANQLTPLFNSIPRWRETLLSYNNENFDWNRAKWLIPNTLHQLYGLLETTTSLIKELESYKQ